MKKIIIVAPVSKSLINFRGDLIKDMKNKGYNVITASPALSGKYVNIFQQQKIDNIPINFQRNKLNPFYDLVTLIKLFKVIKKNKITVVHAHNYFPLISPISFLIIKLSGAKLVHTLHNFRPWCLAGTFYRNNHGVCHLCVEKGPAYGVFYKCYKNSYIMSLYISFLFLIK